MRIKTLAVWTLALSSAVSALAAGPEESSTNFTVSTASGVPGATLQPGSYSIHVINHLSDRVIVAVDSTSGDVHTTFLAIPNNKIAKPGSGGAVRWPHRVDGTEYLKGWFFAGSPAPVEFVYPKAEAVAIATANPAKVPAIDPASEGKPADNTISKSDMQLLTLWLLSFEQVGPGDSTSGIKAVRYDQTASASRQPVIPALPHTGSLMPMVWLIGFWSLAGAGVLRMIVVLSGRDRQGTLNPPGR